MKDANRKAMFANLGRQNIVLLHKKGKSILSKLSDKEMELPDEEFRRFVKPRILTEVTNKGRFRIGKKDIDSEGERFTVLGKRGSVVSILRDNDVIEEIPLRIYSGTFETIKNKDRRR